MLSLKKLSLALAAGGLMTAATGANAFLNLFPNTLLEDDDFEIQAVDLNSNGLLDVGDTLRGIANITRIVDLDGVGPNYDPAELTVVFENEVKSKTATANPTLFDFEFGPVGGATGAIFYFYEDASNNFGFGPPACATVAACEGTATDGTLWATFGFTGDADEQWDAASAPDNTLSFLAIPSSIALGNFRFALNNIYNGTGYKLDPAQVSLPLCGILFTCAGDGKTDMIGSGSALGTSDLNTPYVISSDTDFTIKVPEPATLALVALGLFGAGASSRRRRV